MARKTLELMLVLLIAGCSREAGPRLLPHPVPDQQVASALSGVCLEILEVHQTEGRYEIVYELTNLGGEAPGYGEYAALEKMMKDGWYGIIYSDAVFYRNPEFIDYGEMLRPGATERMTLDTGDLGTVLTPGTYRLVKTITGTDGFEYSVAAEFEIK
ncbi:MULTISPECIES: immunoglobulin-like domain-containing protein [Bhargavaea]|uniref:Immunoglobulin-like domain-containing protein n=1 Tax=Bhargavaea changchunensis TaxID=2134037 RepID=A0ABW2NK98_9BACL|nr:immunoglobulin-like domain-containing protein [Bhargavaea sp. CC-171006]